jgi:AraC-like DNA-binding protein
VVVFGDHRFCAGKSLDVVRMPAPHMHSQIELNFVLCGAMTYWFDGRKLSVSADRLVIFWGMIPHQVVDLQEPTQFVCLYIPMSVLLALPVLSRLRMAVLGGAMVEARDVRSYDREIFLRWRDELLSGDTGAEDIVRDELGARVRRLDREGWHDLRAQEIVLRTGAAHDGERLVHVERMARFIGERAHEDIGVEDVAGAVGLHPSYAMTLFKRTLGLTINQSIVRQRLDTARSLLVASDRSIAEVAFDAGFGSLSRFYDAFEQRYQISPGAFRHRLKSDSRVHR